MRRLRAVFFDIDDTLYCTTRFAALARRNAVRALLQLGVRMSEADLARELEEVILEFTSNDAHHFDRLLSRLPAPAVTGLNPGMLTAGAVVAYHRTKALRLRPYPGAISLLRDIAACRTLVGVISSGVRIKQFEKLLRLGAHLHVSPNAVFISDEVGIGKPNPKLYRFACNRVNVPPEESMYVGDNPITDIDPAHQAGMRTVRLRKPGKYARAAGKVTPDHEVRSFAALRGLLRDTYRIPLP